MYPVTTVLIQNAVLPHQFGIVTGTLNFFRLLGGTIIVAGLGAIVLTKVDASGGLAALDRLAKSGVQPDADFSSVFSWVFIAAASCLVAALVCLAGIEERPLRGPAPRRRRLRARPRRSPPSSDVASEPVAGPARRRFRRRRPGRSAISRCAASSRE